MLDLHLKKFFLENLEFEGHTKILCWKSDTQHN